MKRKDYIGKTVVERAVTSDGMCSTTYHVIKKLSKEEDKYFLLDAQKNIICSLDDIEKTIPQYNTNGDLILAITYTLS